MLKFGKYILRKFWVILKNKSSKVSNATLLKLIGNIMTKNVIAKISSARKKKYVNGAPSKFLRMFNGLSAKSTRAKTICERSSGFSESDIKLILKTHAENKWSVPMTYEDFIAYHDKLDNEYDLRNKNEIH